jgi:chemotaxis protein CheC
VWLDEKVKVIPEAGGAMFEKLNEARLDILREICSVGAGHAATALSQLTGRRIDLEVPQVRFVKVQDVPRIAGGAETVVDGLYFRILGDARGVILMIFPEKSGQEIVRLVLGTAETVPEDALSVSAMREIGNILTSAFLSAIGQLAGLSLIPSVPGYARDMAGSILDLVLIELARLEDTALVIETLFLEGGEGIHGHFFLLPDPQTLEATLRAIEKKSVAGATE